MTNTTWSSLSLSSNKHLCKLVLIISKFLQSIILERKNIKIPELDFSANLEEFASEEVQAKLKRDITDKKVRKLTLLFTIRGPRLSYEGLYDALRSGFEESSAYKVAYAWDEPGMDGYGRMNFSQLLSSLVHHECAEYESDTNSEEEPVPKGRYARFLNKYFPDQV